MFYKGKTVLVTGGTGFIGTNLVEELMLTGANLRIPVHNRVLNVSDNRIETVQADLTKADDCSRIVKGVDYVFHAAGAVASAGATGGMHMEAIATNVTLLMRMLQAAWNEGVKRFLFFSSSTGYAVTDYPIKEEEMWNMPVDPAYFGYGWSRRYMERLGEFVASKSDMKIAIVRPTAVYGPWDNYNPATSHVIPALIHKAVQKMNPFEVWGTGEEIRDMLHARDLARGCLLLLEKYAECDPINIGYGQGNTIKEAVQIILEAAAHSDCKVFFDESKPTTIPIRVVDTQKAKRMLGFEPRISLERGLTDTVIWYKKLVNKEQS